MDNFLSLLIPFLSGLIIGGGLVWLVARARFRSESGLADHFKALASDTLRDNAETFLKMAESRLKQSEQAAASVLDRKTTAFDEMVKPVKESLQKMDAQIQALEVKREGAYRELTEIVKMSHETHRQLRGETSQLLQALRSPNTRGQWGEIQLKRMLEMTGMSAHARDFQTQVSLADGAFRPDLIVNLPSERCVIIDSKVPLASYLDAAQAADEFTRQNLLKQYAKHVREHVKLLAGKSYWTKVESSPEFVVMFLPADHFLGAALDNDADLTEYCVAQNVVLATPMILLAILRTVASVWKQDNLRENVKQVGVLGGELYTALRIMTDHMGTLGNKLSGSLDSYNSMIGSFERNVLSKARKLKEFGAAKDGKQLPDAMDPIDIHARALTPPSEDAA